MSFRIRLEKETVKFSCSHFTIFGAESAEALHGHNYYVSAEFGLNEINPQLGMAFDFNLLKPILKSLAEQLDEHVLVPTRSPFLKIETTPDAVKITHADHSYSFPARDVLLLDIVNVTSEELAREFANRLIKEFKVQAKPEFKRISTISIGIQETRGQTIFYDTKI
jgi:6-pyruvoyltetrahydropterin/6-carboxytetrahydropterin synthase